MRLESLGHEVISIVETGEEAVSQAAAAEVVLMDIRLDGPMDGIQAAARIREEHAVPVIFLTAHTDRATLERAKASGPFGYLVKPLVQASLQTAIEIAVYKHRMERELEEREAWLTSILSSISDAVIATGPAGNIQMLNPAAEALTGWTQADAESESVSKLLAFTDADSGEPCEDPIPLAIVRDASIALGRNAQMETRNGTKALVEGEAAPVKANGGIIGAVLNLRDVSARKWEEQHLRQTQKMEVAARLAAGHDGYLQAAAAAAHGIQFEVLLPRWMEPESFRASEGIPQQPTILLVEAREAVRSQIHNYFESNGYNLLEAGDAAEALALAEIHDGSLDLVIAPEGVTAGITEALQPQHPSLLALKVVDDIGTEAPDRIHHPYTQLALMEKVTALLRQTKDQATAASAS